VNLSLASLMNVSSNDLANRLIEADSVQAFCMQQEGGSLDWRVLASLKLYVDHLVTCDLKAAAHLVGRVQELAEFLKDPIAAAFADASRARLLHYQGNHQQANALYDQASNMMRSAGLSAEAAKIHKQQIDALMYLGRYDDALALARTARPHLKRE